MIRNIIVAEHDDGSIDVRIRDGGSIDELLGLPKGWDDKFGLGD
ncbi:hypothetical protein Tco_0719785, partial [Tanacetum coccineum]